MPIRAEKNLSFAFSVPLATDAGLSFRSAEIPVSARSSIAGQCGASGRKAVELKAGSQAARVLEALQDGPKTDHELVERTGLPLTTVLARRWSLIKRNLIQGQPVGKKRHGDAWNALWAVTEQEQR